MLLNKHCRIPIYVPPSLSIVVNAFSYHEVGYCFEYISHIEQNFPHPALVVICRCPHHYKRGADQSFPAYMSLSSSTIILCNMMQTFIILKSFLFSQNRAGPCIIAKRACSTPNAHSTSFHCPSLYFVNNFRLSPCGL